MKTTEIRVRPVIRHCVQRFVSEEHADGTFSGSSGSIGEFSHEAYAEEVAHALKEQVAPRVYVVVRETLGDETDHVLYAYSAEEAAERKSNAEQSTGKSYRVYSRIKEPLFG